MPVNTRPTIAVDIDDVILAEAAFVVAYSNKNWGTTMQLNDYREHWREMWPGISDKEFKHRVDVLHAPGVQISYDFVTGAEPALRTLAERFTLVVLTSRSKPVQEETVEWVTVHLAGIFNEFHFTNFWDNPDGHLLTKGELAKQIGADYLIDDQPKHCFAAAEAGVQAVLFGDYGVSRELELPANVTRCPHWAAVLEYFDGVKA